MTIFIDHPNKSNGHSLLRVLVRIGDEDSTTVDALFVFGCLAIHESVTSNDLTITHIQSGYMVCKLSKSTPIESISHQLSYLSRIMEGVFHPKEMSKDGQSTAKKIQDAIIAIDAIYR